MPPKTRKVAKTRTPHTKLSGLIFPVGRLNRLMRKRNYTQRMNNATPVHLAAAMEHVVGEVLHLAAGYVQEKMDKKRITPKALFLAVQRDDNLKRLLHNVTIARGGVRPHIEKVLFPKDGGEDFSDDGDDDDEDYVAPDSDANDDTDVTDESEYELESESACKKPDGEAQQEAGPSNAVK